MAKKHLKEIIEGRVSLHLEAVNYKNVKYYNRFNKEEFRGLFNHIRKYVREGIITADSTSDPSMARLLSLCGDSKDFVGLLKDDLVILYLSITSTSENAVRFGKMSESMIRTWKMLLENATSTSEDVTKVLGRNIGVCTASTWGGGTIAEPAFFPLYVETSFSSYFSRKDREYIFSISPTYREFMVKSLFGQDSLNAAVYKDLPDKGDYIIENFEPRMVGDVKILGGLALSHSLATPSGSVTMTKIRMLKKQMEGASFYGNDDENGLDRISLLAESYNAFSRSKFANKNHGLMRPEIFAKYLVKEYKDSINSKSLSDFLTEFTGISKSWADNNNASTLVSHLNFLIKPAIDGWMSMSNFKLRFLCLPLPKYSSDTYNTLFSIYTKSRHCLKRKSENNYIRGNSSQDIKWFDEIDYPFLMNWLRFLCAAGILELAIKKDEMTTHGGVFNFESIKYIRLTALGLYAYDISDKYEGISNESIGTVEVDMRNNILTLPSPDNPYKSMLSLMGKQISPTRFYFSPVTIMRGCSSKKEIEERINGLEAVVDKEGKKQLAPFLKEVKERMNCTIIDELQYLLLKFDPSVPGLVDFLSHNREIRENCVFCEQSMILLKKGFEVRFKNICLEAGYMFDI